MIKLTESKKIDEEGTQVGGVLSNPADDNIFVDDDEDNKRRKKRNINESEDYCEADYLTCNNTMSDNQVDGSVDIVSSIPLEEPSVKLIKIEKEDNSYEYDDPKYYDIIDKLAENGYDAKFFGSEGYLVNNEDANVKIVCRTISEGFKVNIVGGLFSQEVCKSINSTLSKVTKLVEELNSILTSNNDIDESISVDLNGLGELDD